jgi:hypothetical protein
VRLRVAGLVALMLVLLSACTGLGNPDQTKACRALADQVPGISGVKDATFTDAVMNSLPRCSGVVVLDPGLSTAQRGQAVGSAYDIVRTRGVKEVEFNTQFSLGAATLLVSSGYPTTVELAFSSLGGLLATLHARVSSTSPAVSLREGIALLSLAPPAGIREIDWYLNDKQIISPNITSDEATHLEAIASWFEKNPAVTSYSLTSDAGIQTWALITSLEVPDVVGTFPTAGSGTTVRLSASLAGKGPYITIP